MNYPLSLLNFQKQDFDHLKDVSGALIINDMGTGKTYEAIARDLYLRSTGQIRNPRTLIIAPLSTLDDVWVKHYEELTKVPISTVHPKARDGSWMDYMAVGGVFCVHWEAIRLMPQLGTVNWLHIIADECQGMKNRKAQATQALKAIRNATFKTAMSGTPSDGRPDEMWSVLNWLYPQRYRSYWKFFNRYVEYQTLEARGRRFKKIIGPQNGEEFRKEIEPFYVRRHKEDVLKDLPEKYHTQVHVDLTPEQKRIYDQMKKDMVAWLGKQEDEVLPAPVVVAQLVRLSQFADAFATINPETGLVRLTEPSSKLDAVMQKLDEAGGKKVIVFTKFKGMVRLLSNRLHEKSISYVALTGDTPKEDRRSLIAAFQRGPAQVFVGTIRAGGVGIDLFASSTVIFIDRELSSIRNSQAEDRAHRIGQKNAVQVIDVMARNTVDRGNKTTFETKKSWIKALLG